MALYGPSDAPPVNGSIMRLEEDLVRIAFFHRTINKEGSCDIGAVTTVLSPHRTHNKASRIIMQIIIIT